MISAHFSLLLQMFYDPRRAFEALRRNPHSWLPLAAFAAGMAAIQFWYFQTVDQAWMAQREGGAPGPVAPALTMWVTMIVTAALVPAGCAAYAVYLRLAGKMAGFPVRFREWFAFAAWTTVPNLLLLPLMAFQVASSGGQLELDELALASLNSLLLELPYTHAWAGIASHIDLALVWSTALAVGGLRAWTGCGMARAIALALVPVVSVYGAWAASIVLFG